MSDALHPLNKYCITLTQREMRVIRELLDYSHTQFKGGKLDYLKDENIGHFAVDKALGKIKNAIII